jgi:hypothetical protein
VQVVEAFLGIRYHFIRTFSTTKDTFTCYAYFLKPAEELHIAGHGKATEIGMHSDSQR